MKTGIAKSVSLIIIGAALLAVLGACAKPPTLEMDNAAAAVTRAENDPDVAAYAGNTLRRAQDTLRRMQDEANAKRYDAAKNLAQEATAAADKAIADARAAAAKAKQDAAAQIGEVKQAIADAEKALASAMGVRNIKLDFNAMKQQVENARRLIEEAEIALSGNASKEALDKSNRARSTLGSVMTAISDAVRATSRKQ